MSTVFQDALAELVAGWDEAVPCGSVFPCSNEAVWWVNQHGCDHRTVCTDHLMRWMHDLAQRITGSSSGVRCPDCGQRNFTKANV
jgi:DNA-directed RNA polymerase subunit RPC12/RpoP